MNLFIISGGQTGVDRAALDVAMEMNIPCSGWCPRGRWAEDGPINERYPLKETNSTHPDERTKKNILDSDGTLILTRHGQFDAGTKTTLSLVTIHRKPFLKIDLEHKGPESREKIIRWLESHRIVRLNIAGTRESNDPGIYIKTRQFIYELLEHISRS